MTMCGLRAQDGTRSSGAMAVHPSLAPLTALASHMV